MNMNTNTKYKVRLLKPIRFMSGRTFPIGSIITAHKNTRKVLQGDLIGNVGNGRLSHKTGKRVNMSFSLFPGEYEIIN